MPRPLVPPPQRCAARNRSGQPCKRYCRPGQATCNFHGGKVPAALRNGAVRATLAALLTGDPRPPWVVLAEHSQTLDALAREARSEAAAGTLDGNAAATLASTAQAAIAAAKIALDAGVAERLAESRTGQDRAELAGTITQTLDTVMSAVVSAVPPVVREGWRRWGEQASAAALLGDELPPVPPLGVPALPPGPLGAAERLRGPRMTSLSDSCGGGMPGR